MAVAIHPRLLVDAMDETAHESDVELTEHWNVTDPHIMAVLLAMRADLEAGSPAGRLYGESLANALAVYLLSRYAVHHRTPASYRGGLPGYRLKRVLDHIADNLPEDISLRHRRRGGRAHRGFTMSMPGSSRHYGRQLDACLFRI